MTDKVLTTDSTSTTDKRKQNVQSGRERTVSPRASVYENSEAVLLELEMPGVAKEAIDITVENDELSVYGKRYSSANDNLEVVHRERLPFNYRRAFVLSERIDAARISADYKDGILKLILPKAVEAKPRKIEIG